MRRKDADGHLHVEWSNITKANVCPYYGYEIPGAESLGLDPKRVYMLYRDPAELAAAASTFAGKPLLLHHKPVTSEDHPTELVIGSVGSTVEWKNPFLRAPLSIWRQDGIDAIEDEEQREISCGYRYKVDMTPGMTPEGVAFHGRMRNIMGNHVTIVDEGRAGHDVVVADQNPPEFSDMKFPNVARAIAAIIPGMKAADALALDAALAADGLKTPEPVEDEFPELSATDRKTALDSYASKLGKALDKMDDEDKRAAFKAAKDGKTPPAASAGSAPPHAQDAALVDKRIADAVAAATAGLIPKADADKLAADASIAADKAARNAVHALYKARQTVEPTVGVVALDSAVAVYRFALDHLKVEHKDVTDGALAALYEQSAKAAAAPAIAADHAAVFDPSILGLSHIRKG
jgi:hypothetical protein